MSTFWNERFREKNYIYGTKPNQFLAEQIGKLPLGTILFPCDGEGRNSVYAAKIGWKAVAFDQSEEGMKKALLLAKDKNVSIEYHIADALEIEFSSNSFDVIALLYAHFSPEIRCIVHRKIINWLRPGGVVIIEAFNPSQINNTSGGPKDINMLYSDVILKDDFKELNTKILCEESIILDEGNYHQGKADVVRYIGIKL